MSIKVVTMDHGAAVAVGVSLGSFRRVWRFRNPFFRWDERKALASARKTVAAMSDQEGWGADVEAIRSGKRDDHRVRIAARAILDAKR